MIKIRPAWNWVTTNFVGLERFVVTVAAVLAVFPLWQWYVERNDRRLERVALLVEANLACSQATKEGIIFDKHTAPLHPSSVSLHTYIPPELRETLFSNWKENVELMCVELQDAASIDEATTSLILKRQEDIRRFIEEIEVPPLEHPSSHDDH